MPKVNKNVITLGDVTAESVGKAVSFPAEYKEWEKKCAGLKGGAIGVLKGSLLDAVKNHAIPVRPASDNDGNTGSFTTLQKVASIINQRKNGIYFDDDADAFETVADEIDDLIEHDTLNPQNIMFSVPEKYNKTTGSYPKGVDMVPIYGHYLDDYFKTKHKDKLQGRQSNDTWYNSSKDTAKPPIYQALMGGALVTVGLLEIMKKATDQIDNQQFHLEIRPTKPAKYLINIPTFRRALASAIGAKSSQVDGNVSVSKVTSKLTGKRFTTKAGDIKPLKEYTKRRKNILGGDFSSFEIVLTPAKTKTLIKYYMQSNMKVKTRTLTKSWQEILVV